MLIKLSTKLMKGVIIIMAVGIIVFALIINTGRLLLPLIADHRIQIETWASHSIHQPVLIGRIKARWHGFQPTFSLDNVIITDPASHQPVIHLKKLTVGVDLFHSLWHWKILPSYLSIDGVGLVLEQTKKGNFFVRGVPISNITWNAKTKTTAIKDAFLWLLTQGNVNIHDVSILCCNQNGIDFPIHNLRLKVINRLNEHLVTGIFAFKQIIPTKFHFIFRFSHLSLDDYNFDGEGYLKASQLSLAQWDQFNFIRSFFPALPKFRGRLNTQTWVTWKKGQLVKVQSRLTAKHIIVSKENSLRLPIDFLHANLAWDATKEGWALKADHFFLRMPGIDWKNKQWGYQIDRNQNQALHLFAINNFHLQDLLALKSGLNYFPDQIKKMLFTLQPRGDLNQFQLAWQQDASDSPKITISTYFKNIGLNQYGKIPAFSGMSGYLFYSPDQGMLNLDTNEASVYLANVFSHPFSHLIMHVKATWKNKKNHLKIHFPHYFLSDHYLSLHGLATLNVPKQGKITLKLLSAFHLNDVHQVVNYMPKKILTPGLKKWMNQAFVKGQLTDGVMVLRGPLDQFPFDHHQGRFEIATTLKNMTMSYFPGWPEFSNIQGKIVFDGRGMKAFCHGGTIAGNPMDSIHASIPNLEHPVLSIHGQSSSDLQFASNFLSHSPLSIGKALSVVQFHGPMKLDIHLKVTIRKKNSTVFSKGFVTIHDGTMDWPALHLSVNHINGNLNFVNANLSSQNVVGQFFDSPMNFNLSTLTVPHQSPVIQIEVGGKLDLKKIRSHVDLPILHYLTGSTSYRGVFTIHNGADQSGDNFSVMSNLTGITIHGLPPPYNKNAVTPRDFLFHVILDKNDIRMTSKYANLLSSALMFDSTHHHFQLASADLHFGSGMAETQNLPGIVIEGKLKNFDWDRWHPLFSQFSMNSSSQGLLSKMPLRYIELSIGQLHYNQFDLKNLYLKIISHARFWMINLQSALIAGIVDIPKQSQKIWHIQLQHLSVPKFKNSKSEMEINPVNIPPLDLHIKDFSYGKMDLGQINLQTQETKKGVIIKNFTSESSLISSQLKGYWKKQNKQMETALSGAVTSNNFGKFMLQQNLTNHLSGGKGTINFSLKWHGSPLEFDMKQLKGTIDTDLSDGSILMPNEKIGTELGLGRLINILSVQSLLRRLTFNFSDLTSKGLTFDSLKSHFVFDHGIAYTQDSYMSGPIAKVILSGDIDFNIKSMNLVLTVEPIVTSSLPFIVGVAGGPIAGAVTWVVNKMISPGISRAVRQTYQIMGSWDRPIVIKLSKRKI